MQNMEIIMPAKSLSMKQSEHRAWWDEMVLCQAKNKKGVYCRSHVRRAYEKQPGDLFIPLTCPKHADQEEAIRKALK